MKEWLGEIVGLVSQVMSAFAAFVIYIMVIIRYASAEAIMKVP